MTDRPDLPELVAPRRVFKRKRNKGLINALKIGLPLIAVACVGYIVYWSREAPRVTAIETFGEQGSKPSQSVSDVKVQRVQYNGVDASNRPYSITAESASQPQKVEPAPVATGDADGDGDAAPAAQPATATVPATAAEPDNVINLKKLMADMTMSDGAWVALTADNGVFHRDQGTVDLSGNVTLFHDTGLTFETDAATVDLKNDWASGNQPVEGQNADGELAAQGFEIKDDGKTILFTGRSYLKLYPKKSGGGS
jgi:lipopolysaccharide export system protein LptC